MGVAFGSGNTLEDVVAEDLDGCYKLLGDSVDQVAGSKILVTGAAGFLGSYLVDFFLSLNQRGQREPCTVIGLDNYSTGSRDRLAHLRGTDGFSEIDADIADPFSLPPEVRYIVHAASIASPVVYRRYPLQTIRANVHGTWNLLEAAKNADIRSILFLSTSEIYGDPVPEQIPTPETYWGNVNPVGPRACYDEAKRMGETLCATYFREYQIPVKICRLFNVYGPRMPLEDGRLITDLMNAIRHQRPLTLYSDGEATRSFCYVSDALYQLLCVLLLGSDGQVYNVGDDEEITVRQVADLLAETMGVGKDVEYTRHPDVDYITDNPQRRCPDLSRIRSLTRQDPSIRLGPGLLRTARWHGLDAAS